MYFVPRSTEGIRHLTAQHLLYCFERWKQQLRCWCYSILCACTSNSKLTLTAWDIKTCPTVHVFLRVHETKHNTYTDLKSSVGHTASGALGKLHLTPYTLTFMLPPLHTLPIHFLCGLAERLFFTACFLLFDWGASCMLSSLSIKKLKAWSPCRQRLGLQETPWTHTHTHMMAKTGVYIHHSTPSLFGNASYYLI